MSCPVAAAIRAASSTFPPRDLRDRLHVSLAEAPAFWHAFCNYARELGILQLKREFVYLLLMA